MKGNYLKTTLIHLNWCIHVLCFKMVVLHIAGNTVSNVALIVPPFFGLCCAVKDKMEPAFIYNYIGLLGNYMIYLIV